MGSSRSTCLIVNLYPFEETVAKGRDHATCIENIDIGGPAMIRAASKNHRFVTVVTDPVDYAPLLDQMRAHDGATTLAFRQKLALTAYSRTAAYDTAVSIWLAGEIGEATPRYRSFAGKLAQPCAMARTRTSPPPFTPTAAAAPAWQLPANGRARAFLQQHQRHGCRL
jgi:AICAR transformylase/IMP cyclohydrolase PurH